MRLQKVQAPLKFGIFTVKNVIGILIMYNPASENFLYAAPLTHVDWEDLHT